MADLIDRIAFDSFQTGRPSINMHRWIGVQRLYALGEWTALEIGTEFDIIGHIDEERQATQIKTVIDGLNATNKMIYLGRVEGVLYCVQDRDDRLYHNADASLNKTKIFEDLQILG